MFDTEDGMSSQDKNQMGGKVLAVLERYKALLEHDYYSTGYMLYMDVNKYEQAKVNLLYIYVNYHVIFLQYIILKII